MTIEPSPQVQPYLRRLTGLGAEIANTSDRVILIGLFVLLFWRQCGKELFSLFAGEEPFSTFRAAEFIGFAAVFVVLRSLRAAPVLRRPDFVAIAAAALALVLPTDHIGGLVLTGLGLLFIVRRDGRLSSVGQLCAGLAWIEIWGTVVLGFIGPWLLPVETALGFFVASLFGSFSLLGNAILAGDTHSIIMYPECSSFGNTVRTSFIWLSLLKMQELNFSWRHFRILAVGLCGVIALNTLHLALMAQTYAAYLYWHTGPGGTMVAAVMLIFVLGLFYRGLKPGRLRMA